MSFRGVLHTLLVYPRALVVFRRYPTSLSSFSLPFLSFLLAATKCWAQGCPPNAIVSAHKVHMWDFAGCKGAPRAPCRWCILGYFIPSLLLLSTFSASQLLLFPLSPYFLIVSTLLSPPSPFSSSSSWYAFLPLFFIYFA